MSGIPAIFSVGKRYGRLLVLSLGQPKKAKTGGKNLSTLLCKCDCGTIKEILLVNLRHGTTYSCGCLQREFYKSKMPKNVIHGLSEHRLYFVWKDMIRRCANIKYIGYHNYGGRGITVCDEWKEFLPFYNWAISNGYEKGLELDRRENNGNYTPENCRFVTDKVNARNKRITKFFTYNGENKPIAEWAEIFGTKTQLLSDRLGRGWDLERAAKTPATTKFLRKTVKLGQNG